MFEEKLNLIALVLLVFVKLCAIPRDLDLLLVCYNTLGFKG